MLRFDRAGNFIVALFNFTPVVRENYRIGVPEAGSYREILNTDSELYGGSNVGNWGRVPTIEQEWMGYQQALELTLPPLGALFLCWEEVPALSDASDQPAMKRIIPEL